VVKPVWTGGSATSPAASEAGNSTAGVDQVMMAVLRSAKAWPGGVVSCAGLIVIGIVIVGQVMGSFFQSSEYIATLVVGALLSLLGPVAIAVEGGSARNTVETLARSSDIEANMREREAELNRLKPQ
jgi:hypothetical protein